MHHIKKFTKINDPFVCLFCGHPNPPAPKTCRDHCRQCLASLHVDKNPGDRAETCQGKLIPTQIDIQSGEMHSILYLCAQCGSVRKNKIAEDDNKEVLWNLFRKHV